MPLNTLSKSR